MGRFNIQLPLEETFPYSQIMRSALYSRAKTVVSSKIDSSLNVGHALNLSDVVRNEALCAGYAGIVVNVTVAISVFPC
jgi:hypothetical protein